ncbi:MAG: VOC family protein [Phycisphaerales bacterium]
MKPDNTQLDTMRPHSILESVLYSADLESSLWMFSEVLGFPVIRDMSSLGFGVRVDESHVLIVFDPRETDKPGRDVPSHGARGPGHLAMQIRDADYDAWKQRLSSFGVGIEQEIEWTQEWRFAPGRSIYFRDSYGNSLELITSDIWGDGPFVPGSS